MQITLLKEMDANGTTENMELDLDNKQIKSNLS